VHSDAINFKDKINALDKIGVIDPLDPDVLRVIEAIKSMKFSSDHPSEVRKLMKNRQTVKVDFLKKEL